MHGIITRMDFCDTVRESTRRLLATTGQPLTADAVADRLGTTRTQAGRALRQLEAQGAAVRERGRPGGRPGGGRAPGWWSAARP
jgi:predicted ArsR family transcriptional regulator